MERARAKDEARLTVKTNAVQRKAAEADTKITAKAVAEKGKRYR